MLKVVTNALCTNIAHLQAYICVGKQIARAMCNIPEIECP